MAKFGLYSATLTPAAGAFALNQLGGQDFSPAVQIEEHVVPGAVDRAVNVVMSGDPRVALRTHDLDSVKTNISITTGVYCSSGAVFRLQKRAANTVDGAGGFGAFTAGSTHVNVSSSGGIACIVSLSARQNQLAEAMLQYMPNWDGSTNPLVYNTTQALASAPAYNSLFTLGPAKISTATWLEGFTGFELSSGLQFVPRFANGSTYPTEFTLERRTPSLRLMFDSPDAVANVTNLFHASLSAALTIFLRRKLSTAVSGNIADATATNAKIVVSAGSWGVDGLGASGHDSASLKVPVLPTGTISWDVASAIA